MEEPIGVPLSTALSIALAIVGYVLIMLCPFLWPKWALRSRKRFPRRGTFCLVVGLAAYALVGCVLGILTLLYDLFSVAAAGDGDAAGSSIRPLGRYLWLLLAPAATLTSVYLSDQLSPRWRDWVRDWESR